MRSNKNLSGHETLSSYCLLSCRISVTNKSGRIAQPRPGNSDVRMREAFTARQTNKVSEKVLDCAVTAKVLFRATFSPSETLLCVTFFKYNA